jgi:Ni,Fe-hydrogenase III component G
LEERDSERQISNFLMLFRLLMPELYNHFQEEEVDTKEWTQSWMETLLSKQLPIDSKYFLTFQVSFVFGIITFQQQKEFLTIFMYVWLFYITVKKTWKVAFN